MMQKAKELAVHVGKAKACRELNVSRMTEYRTRRSQTASQPRKAHPRALTNDERAAVIAVLSSDDHVDSSPATAYATLLDNDRYFCSVSTMYRVLRANKAVLERRNQRRMPIYTAPELVAQRPNEVWSWDITKVSGVSKFEYYHVYVMMDIYSRKVVGWMLAERESGCLAAEFIETCCRREDISSNTLTIHSDRGAAMISKPVVALLAELDIIKSVSRPHVSNDNPFSESLFKTMKYRPVFPKRFGSAQDGRTILRPFFDWYNEEHRHSGIGYMTPNAVHSGKHMAIREARRAVLKNAFMQHPERFVRGAPKPAQLPSAAWINPPKVDSLSQAETQAEEVLIKVA